VAFHTKSNERPEAFRTIQFPLSRALAAGSLRLRSAPNYSQGDIFHEDEIFPLVKVAATSGSDVHGRHY
jgi:hypothetical protein